MAVDYIIALPCTPKDELGDDLVDLVKLRSKLRAAREAGGEGSLELLGPAGGRSVSAEEIQRAIRPLETHAEHCLDCPASILDETYGCLGGIAYPISAAAEEWLLARLPERLDEPPGSHLGPVLQEFDITGETAEEMRSRGFLEAREPATRRWDDDEISSSELLELLLFTRPLPAILRLFLVLLSAVEVPEPDVLKPYLEGRQSLPFQLDLDPSEDRSIQAMKGFLRTMYVAAALGVKLPISP